MITNTEKQDPMLHLMSAMLAGNSLNDAILAQEAQGQTEVVHSDQIPLDGPNDGALIELGFELSLPQSDPLFRPCKFPDGWTKRPTDHSMYTEVLDEQGRVRGLIGYKAAFYDRWANFRLNTRYTISTNYCDSTGKPVSYAFTHVQPVVKDCDKIIHSGKIIPMADYGDEAVEREVMIKWLDENFPDHNSVKAYW